MERDSGQVFEEILKKYREHPRLLEVTGQLWSILKVNEHSRIGFQEYCQLMMGILKTLLPSERDLKEMKQQVLEYWKRDTECSDEMNYTCFHKAIFRVAHEWCINLDVIEYVGFIAMLFKRLTMRRVFAPDRPEDGEVVLPNIFLEFPAEEETIFDEIARVKAEQAEGEDAKEEGPPVADWESCLSDESQDSRYEYNYVEDEKNMQMKKYKRQKAQKRVHALSQRLKEPIYYEEVMEYPKDLPRPPSENARINHDTPLTWNTELAPFEDIIPIGYLAEQLITGIKNEGGREITRPDSSMSKASALPGGNTPHVEVADLLKVGEQFRSTALQVTHLKVYLPVRDKMVPKPRFFTRYSEICNDILIHKINNNMDINLRLDSQRNLPGPRDPTVPPPMINKTHANQILDRRVVMELHKPADKAEHINVNYIIEHPRIKEILASDIMRVEHPERLVLKPSNNPQTMGTTHMSGFNDAMKRPKLMNEKTITQLEVEMVSAKFEAISKERIKAQQREERKRREEAKEEPPEEERKEPLGDSSEIKPQDISRITARTGGAQDSALANIEAQLSGKPLPTQSQREVRPLPPSLQPPVTFPELPKALLKKYVSKNGIKSNPLNKENDPVQDAGALPLSIVIIGKPRSGKTTLARNLAQKLDIVHIEPTIILNALIKKIQEYEPPESLEEGEEPPKFLTDLEEEVSSQLKHGRTLSHDHVFRLIESGIESDAAQSKGFVLDLPFSLEGPHWGELIKNNHFAKMPAASISYIVELDSSNEDIHLRASHMMISSEEEERLKDGSGCGIFSRYDRSERKRIYEEFKRKMEEDEDFAAEQNQDTQPKDPLDQNVMSLREQDLYHPVEGNIRHYLEEEQPHFLEIAKNMTHRQFIKLNSAGVSPTELAAATEARIFERNPLRPLGIALEGEGDFKGLLTQGLEENEVPREWSLWKQTDPVSLVEDGKVVPGTAEFGASYAGRVFVFSSEDNQKKFVANPKRYLAVSPEMPSRYRLAILGPPGSGRRIIGRQLCEQYGWRFVDIDAIVNDKILEQEEIENREITNPLRDSVDIERSLEHAGESMDGKRSRANSRTSKRSKSKEKTPSKFGSRKGSQNKSTLSQSETPSPHIMNNPDGGRIGFSLDEYNSYKDGNPFKATDIAAWILDYLGVPLQKYREPPPPPKEKEEGEEGEEGEGEEGKDQNETGEMSEAPADPRSASPDRMSNMDAMSSPDIGAKTPEPSIPRVIEDLPVAQISVKVDERWKPPPIGGFVFVAFPQTDEQFKKLKQQGIEFDNIVLLMDTDEESPGAELKERNEKRNKNYEHEAEMEFIEKLKEVIKENVGEDNVETVLREVSCNGSMETVLQRVRLTLDPFFTRLDAQENIRVSGDVAEPEEDEEEIKKNPENKGISASIPVPKSALAQFCPVTYFNESWLFPGGVTGEGLEQYVNGKLYKFAGEKEMEVFQAEPLKYIGPGDQPDVGPVYPLPPPLPHIMVAGPRGSGVSTQLKILSQQYQIPTLEVQQEFLKLVRSTKEQRKHERLLKRGFKAPPPKEDEEEGEEEQQEPEDPEIEEDPEEFEKAEHEKKLMKDVMQPGQARLYDGCWFDVNQEEVGTQYLDLLTEARRLPEIVIFLSISEKKYLERLLDEKGITAKYNAQMEELRKARREQREQERQEKLEERKRQIEAGEINQEDLEEEEPPIDDQEEELEGDDVPNLENMLEEERTKLTERRTADSQNIEALTEALKEKKVPVVVLPGDLDRQTLNIKIRHALQDHLELRESMIERMHARAIRSVDVPLFLKSHVLRPSKFKFNNLMNPANPVRKLNYPAIYRERLYFFNSNDERSAFLKEPLKYANIGLNIDCDRVFPEDIVTPPTAFIVGPPQSGRSNLCARISKETGAVYISMEIVIKDFLKADCILAEEVRDTLGRGRALTDDKIVEILAIRLQQADCVEKGWILNGFPSTLNQAKLLTEKEIIPQFVFHLKLPEEEIVARAMHLQSDLDFNVNLKVVHARIAQSQKQLPQLLNFYSSTFNNLKVLDATKSKWYLNSRVKHWLTQAAQSVLNYSRAVLTNSPVLLENLNITEVEAFSNLSQDFLYYCPVQLKLNRKLFDCRSTRHIKVELGGVVYLLKGQSEWEAFKENPKRFLKRQQLPKNIAGRISLEKCGELANDPKALEGYCPVTLVDQEKLQLGNPLLAANSGNLEYAFASFEKMKRFLQMPSRYDSALLPVKMPPAKDLIRLDQLADADDSIAFLEESLGNTVGRALLELNARRLKHPQLSVKETTLKLFSLFLKANNPGSSLFVQQKYKKKLTEFIQRCEMPVDLLTQFRKRKSKQKSEFLDNPEEWHNFEEDYFHEQGAKYDDMVKQILDDKEDNFYAYVR